MKKKLSVLFVLALFLVSLTGCGGSGEQKPAGAVDEDAVPAHTPVNLVKTATVAYDYVCPENDYVILYESDDLYGVLNLDGSVCIPAEYDEITALNENYIAYRDSAGLTGIMDLDGNVLTSGWYDEVEYVGADYVFLKIPMDCEQTHPKKYGFNSKTGKYYYLRYSFYSLSEKKEVPCSALDIINASDTLILWDSSSVATETYVWIQAYYGRDSEECVFYTYYWESGKMLTDTPIYCDDGCAEIDGQLYNAKGEPIEQCTHREAKQSVEKRDGYYGVVDASGTEIIPFQYEKIKEYTADIYAVRLNDKWGFIDKTGRVLMNPTITEEYKGSGRCFETADTEKPCLYNPYDGTKTVYEELYDLDEDKGIYWAYNETGRGVVTFEKVLIELVYDEYNSSLRSSRDAKTFVAKNGSSYDIYVLE